MTKVKRSWDMLTEEQRKLATKAIVDYFAIEKGETIGVIAAEDLLDMFLQNSGKFLYNKGLEDAKTITRNQFEILDMEIEIQKRDS